MIRGKGIKMKALFIVPYLKNMLESMEEIGISSIAAYIRREGYEVNIISKSSDTLDYDLIASYSPDIIGFPVYDITKESVYQIIHQVKQKLPTVAICCGGAEATHNYKKMMDEEPQIDYIIIAL